MIQYITYGNIDKTKWDDCISRCYNELIYAHSWYLDGVCEQWDALVLNEYEAVMPLPWRKKFGVSYLYQPFFCQQLGIFSSYLVSGFLVDKFLQAIPDKFSYADIQLNEACDPEEYKSLPISAKKNHLLLLPASYEQLWKGYSENARRNIAKANKNELTIESTNDVDSLIDFYQKHNGMRSPEVKDADYSRMKKLLNNLPDSVTLQPIQVMLNKELIAAAIFVELNGRVTYLLGAASEKGKEQQALFGVMDYIMKQYLGKGVVIDFEGSEIEGIARFYKSLGGQERLYFSYKENRLPFIMRLFKK